MRWKCTTGTWSYSLKSWRPLRGMMPALQTLQRQQPSGKQSLLLLHMRQLRNIKIMHRYGLETSMHRLFQSVQH